MASAATVPVGRVNHAREAIMTAFNVVRMRVKPGREKDFLALNKEMAAGRHLGLDPKGRQFPDRKGFVSGMLQVVPRLA